MNREFAPAKHFAKAPLTAKSAQKKPPPTARFISECRKTFSTNQSSLCQLIPMKLCYGSTQINFERKKHDAVTKLNPYKPPLAGKIPFDDVISCNIMGCVVSTYVEKTDNSSKVMDFLGFSGINVKLRSRGA